MADVQKHLKTIYFYGRQPTSQEDSEAEFEPPSAPKLYQVATLSVSGDGLVASTLAAAELFRLVPAPKTAMELLERAPLEGRVTLWRGGVHIGLL